MKSTTFSARFVFVATAIFVAAISRVFPHIPNFTPIAAMALFGGAYLNDKRLAVVVPMLAMFVSDAILELTTGWGFHNTLAYVYGAFLLTTFIGMSIRNRIGAGSILVASVVSSILFFLITNFGVWAASGFQLGVAGLGTTYVLGIPFFGPTLLGDLFFNTILFGAFAIAQRRIPALAKA